tara:strand:+ start:19935 stop:20105 length:171 start_codon:yes stop_codon:yes gene_type:complete
MSPFKKSILERNRVLKATKPTAHELERIKQKEEDRRMAVWYKHTTQRYDIGLRAKK